MISTSNAEMLICAFMTSRLDYCNALLGGCSACLINKLQMVQNAAARVLTRTRKYDHIGMVLSTVALCEQARFTMESLTSKEPDKDHLFTYLCKDTGRERFKAPPPCQLRTDLCSQILLGTEFLTSSREK